MTWKEIVKNTILDYFQKDFTLEDIYKFEDEYKVLKPENNTIKDTLRAVLQDLRDEGFIEFLDDRGNYRFIGETNSIVQNIEIKIGQKYSKEQIEEIFNTKFGYAISRGINLRNFSNGQKAILLFSKENGPYRDEYVGDILNYKGEGEDGDQLLTPNNKALLNSNKENRIIYGFKKEDDKSNLWTYLGILKVIDYDYILENDRMVYEFKIQKTEIESFQQFEKEKDYLLQQLYEEPTLTEERRIKEITNRIKIRDTTFKTAIREIYDDTCVICGKKRYSKADYPEVQAAHIFPVEKEGSDDLRNGISLCRLHHWAFDGGLFVINDDFKIKVREEIKNDSNYEEIYSFDNKKIKLPQNPKLYPAKIYLKAHREIHGF